MDAPTITDAAGIMYDVDERWAKFYSPIVAVSYLPNPIFLSDFYSASELPNAEEVNELFEDRWAAYFTPAIAMAHLVDPGNVDQLQDEQLMEKAEGYIHQERGVGIRIC